jgi:hypothetical protein
MSIVVQFDLSITILLRKQITTCKEEYIRVFYKLQIIEKVKYEYEF